jgi:hypothetical protein
MERNYIFIVGMPRTGTKLVADILQNSQHVDCKISPENFFMGHLIKPGIRHELKKYGDMSNDANVCRLVDDMYAGRFPGTYWELLRSGHLRVDKDMLLREVLNSDRSAKGIYEAMMKVHPDITEDTILGDKNPGHLYHVPALLDWFPQAKIIHTFRDSRAILASEWKRRMNDRPSTLLSTLTKPFYSLLIVIHVTITWVYAARLHQKYKEAYPQSYYLSRFEDLINQPEKSVRELCQFLEVEFDPKMLEPRIFGSSFASQAGTGFDQQALSRWQDNLKPWMNTWLLLWGRKYLREFGYLH